MNFLLTDDQKKLQASVEEFARERVAPVAERLDREAVFPTALFHELAGLGITAIPFGEEWGGLGLGTFEMALALEQIARADQSLAVSTMVSVATGLTLARFGTDAQKQQFLPDIVAGKKICAIAGTEPNAGSDTAGFTTHFTSVVTAGNLRGERGTAGEPGYMLLTGAIAANGSAKLTINGIIANRAYARGIFAHKGEEYTWDAKAQFQATTGSGTRDQGLGIIGRPCTFDFAKQTAPVQ